MEIPGTPCGSPKSSSTASNSSRSRPTYNFSPPQSPVNYETPPSSRSSGSKQRIMPEEEWLLRPSRALADPADMIDEESSCCGIFCSLKICSWEMSFNCPSSFRKVLRRMKTEDYKSLDSLKTQVARCRLRPWQTRLEKLENELNEWAKKIREKEEEVKIRDHMLDEREKNVKAEEARIEEYIFGNDQARPRELRSKQRE